MFGAKWRKGTAPADTKTEAAKPDEAAAAPPAEPKGAPVPVPGTPETPEAAKIEAASEAQPASTGPAASISRASRMVEVTRSKSSRLGRDLKAALARREDWQKPAAAAAIALAIGGLGYATGRQASPAAGETAGRLALVTAEMGESRAETARLSTELKTLRTAFDGFRTDRDRTANRQSQLVEKVERSSTEVAGRIGKLAEQLDRMEKAGREPARTTERATPAPAATVALAAPASTVTPTSVAPTPPPKPTAGLDVTQTGSLAEAKPDPRRQVVESYVLRDVDDGMALVEARNGRFFEVSPGMSLPGLGRVEAIERRGRQWVVLTPKGIVAAER